MNYKKFTGSLLIGAVSAVCGSFIIYCEKLQFSPYTAKGLIGRLGLTALCFGLLFGFIFFLLQKPIQKITKREWIPIIITSLILSVCAMIWFPVPDTGLFLPHDLTIHALPDADGNFHPVTLTWLHKTNGDVPLSEVQCTGNCTYSGQSPSLNDTESELSWHGITGNLITIEFVSDSEQGIAEIIWDGIQHRFVSLNNPEMNRLSYDFTFSPSLGLPEFVSVWILCFFLCCAGIIGLIKCLPEFSIKKLFPAAFCCFAVFRVITFLTVSEPLFFVDSESYLGTSKMSVIEILRGTQYCHKQYWYCIARPAFIPLVYKMCGQNPAAITIVQLIISILSWGYFAYSVSGLCQKNSRKKAAIILTLGLGCIPNVTRWDQIIMSESLSISAAVLFMGSSFRFLAANHDDRWKWEPAISMALSAFLYVQSRDSAVWIVILSVPLLLFLNRLKKNRKIVFILCALMTLSCWSVVSNTGGRWQYPFENVLFNRILRDPQAAQYFYESGVPQLPRIGELIGTEHLMSSRLFNSEQMAPLREWIKTDGLKTYIKYMLRTPFKTLKMTWYDGFEKEAFEQTDYTFTPFGFIRLLPDPIVKFFSCNLPGVIIIGLGITGIFAAFFCKNGERYAFPVLFVLSAYILCTGVYIADEYELARHSMVIIIMMKAASWPLICMLSEEFENIFNTQNIR